MRFDLLPVPKKIQHSSNWAGRENFTLFFEAGERNPAFLVYHFPGRRIAPASRRVSACRSPAELGSAEGLDLHVVLLETGYKPNRGGDVM